MSTFGKRNGGGRRRATREQRPLVAMFTTRTRSHSALLVDLSATGARLRGSDLPGRDEDLILHVEGLAAYGIVKWSRLGFCGIAFDDPLSPGEIKTLERAVNLARCLEHAPTPLAARGLDIRAGHPAESAGTFTSEVLTPRRSSARLES